MKIRAFITHKLSESYSDCQDRFSINCDNRRIAVSDGMSQSIFPELWAELLAQQYTDKGTCNENDRLELCQQWHVKVMDYLRSEQEKGNNPWRLENTIAERNGAGATICGVTFEDAKAWKGHVLGDSCILIVNKKSGKVERICTSEDKAFDSYPDYYESFAEKKGKGKIASYNGTIDSDHAMLLVSDPFSEYAYNHKDNAKQFIDKALSLNTHDEFCSFVDSMRRNEGLHNDDSTLCIVEFDNSLDFNIAFKDDINELIKEEKDAFEKASSKAIPSVEVSVQSNVKVKNSRRQEDSNPLNNGNSIKCTVSQGNKEITLEEISNKKIEETTESQMDLDALYRCFLKDLNDFSKDIIDCVSHLPNPNRSGGKKKTAKSKRKEIVTLTSKKSGESIRSTIEKKLEEFRKAIETQYNQIKAN